MGARGSHSLHPIVQELLGELAALESLEDWKAKLGSVPAELARPVALDLIAAALELAAQGEGARRWIHRLAELAAQLMSIDAELSRVGRDPAPDPSLTGHACEKRAPKLGAERPRDALDLVTLRAGNRSKSRSEA